MGIESMFDTEDLAHRWAAREPDAIKEVNKYLASAD
jgi:hypothetical protein